MRLAGEIDGPCPRESYARALDWVDAVRAVSDPTPQRGGRLTEQVLIGLRCVWVLAHADVQVDLDRYPPRHVVHAGLEYLGRLIERESANRRAE